mgnify:CR=1 FL=1
MDWAGPSRHVTPEAPLAGAVRNVGGPLALDQVGDATAPHNANSDAGGSSQSALPLLSVWLDLELDVLCSDVIAEGEGNVTMQRADVTQSHFTFTHEPSEGYIEATQLHNTGQSRSRAAVLARARANVRSHAVTLSHGQRGLDPEEVCHVDHEATRVY